MKSNRPGSDSSQKIIDVATSVFAQDGFNGARMKRIAEKAGVNQSLLHYYFHSKEKLYEEVLFRFFSGVCLSLANHLTIKADPVDSFKNFIDTYLDILNSRPELSRLMLFELLEGGERLMRVIDRIFAETGVSPPSLAIPFLENARKKNLIRPVDPVQTSLSVMGMCLFYFIARPLMEHVWGKPPDERKFIEQRKKAIRDLVLYGVMKNKQ